MPAPRPVLTTRTVEARGLWLPSPGADPVWAAEPVLRDLVEAAEEDRWVHVDSQSLEDALVDAGFAVRDGDSMQIRGTAALTALVDPERDQHGGQVYDPAVHGPFYPGDEGTEEMDAEARRRGFDSCLGCGVLPVSYSRARYYDNKLDVEYDNALLVTLSGGYGMFFDRPDFKLVICHDCAHALCATHPQLAALLTPLRSHSHTQRYHDDHPDHDGWDYRRQAEQVAAEQAQEQAAAENRRTDRGDVEAGTDGDDPQG